MNQDALQAILAKVTFNADGLVAVIAQRESNNEVLMLAYMNAQSLTLTLQTGEMTYWSRSRKKLWRKGETSGNVQKLKALKIDCDGDTLLALVEQTGAACHTGAINCFFETIIF